MVKRPIFNIIISLFFIFFVICFGRFLFLGSSSGFVLEDFLQMLGTFSQPVLTPFINLSITADWGVFNFFRGFLNLFGGVLSLIYFAGANLVNVMYFVFNIIPYIFGKV